MGGTGSKRRWRRAAMIAAVVAIAGCSGETPAPDPLVNAAPATPAPIDPLAPSGAMVPADVVSQTTSNLASEPAEPVPGLSWSIDANERRNVLRLTEADGTRSLTLACGGRPPRLVALVPGFSTSSIGEPFRLAIGATEIAMTAATPPTGVEGSMGEALIPSNLAELLAAARAIDIVQGAQRLGATPPPPRAMAAEFATLCAARRG